MNTNKAAYWIILGVVALGLNSEYRHGNFAPVHRVAGRAESAFCRLAGGAERALETAAILSNRGRAVAHNLFASKEETEMARAQTEFFRDPAMDEAELLRERVPHQVRENVRKSVRDSLRAQADVMRAQAEIQRAEVEQGRSRAHSEFKLIRTADRRVLVVCPKTGTRISVNAGVNSADTSAVVDLKEDF